ncbi:protein DUF642 L-GALACTONO-1,4-LACTONE-RESPONSIVE GENE 1-like isoform X1 [Gossypium raimondii]|uniref:protein DUF642 L-GALACTONO-1,4-LACTONE-RESPONSIVE GENE 1-like isoform X1 n=1 Tax=Gossypium raimondii TaxID=29730 RepID=UPI00227A28BD|nr:protein DUF642 L-GALACTONO-1,4-LACTONE-RESPONSIVE GENE 1-like isoform X1 [Gossypium raimondii]
MKKVAVFVLLLVCTTSQIASSAKDGLLPNGNFEQGPKASELKGTKVMSGKSIPNREISGYVEYIKSANLLKNGNFEEGPYIFPILTSEGLIIPPEIEDDHSPLPGWIIESLKAIKYIDSEHLSVPQGKWAIELIAGKESAVAQIVKTTIGRNYVLSFVVGDANNGCEGPMMVEAFAGKNMVMVSYNSKGKGGFKAARLAFRAESTRTRIMFYSTIYTIKSDNSGSLCGPVLDDVMLLSVRKLRHL